MRPALRWSGLSRTASASKAIPAELVGNKIDLMSNEKIASLLAAS